MNRYGDEVKFDYNVGDRVAFVNIGGQPPGGKNRRKSFLITCRERCTCDPDCTIALYYGEMPKSLRRLGPYEKYDLKLVTRFKCPKDKVLE